MAKKSSQKKDWVKKVKKYLVVDYQQALAQL